MGVEQQKLEAIQRQLLEVAASQGNFSAAQQELAVRMKILPSLFQAINKDATDAARQKGTGDQKSAQAEQQKATQAKAKARQAQLATLVPPGQTNFDGDPRHAASGGPDFGPTSPQDVAGPGNTQRQPAARGGGGGLTANIGGQQVTAPNTVTTTTEQFEQTSGFRQRFLGTPAQKRTGSTRTTTQNVLTQRQVASIIQDQQQFEHNKRVTKSKLTLTLLDQFDDSRDAVRSSTMLMSYDT